MQGAVMGWVGTAAGSGWTAGLDNDDEGEDRGPGSPGRRGSPWLIENKLPANVRQAG